MATTQLARLIWITAAAAALMTFAGCGGNDPQPVSQEEGDDVVGQSAQERSDSAQEPPSMVFSSTGDFIAGDPDMPLVVHSFEVTPEYLSVVYSLPGTRPNPPMSIEPIVVDDKGQIYETLDNALFGSVDGVLAGVLVVEPHVAGGSVLTIQAKSVVMLDGSSTSGAWSIPFLKTTQPDAPITFIEGGRLSPEDGVDVNGARVGIAGPPGSSPIQVLVQRDGKTSSLFGAVEPNGAAKALSLDEFRSAFGSEGYPLPPSFPTTATAQR